MTPQGSDKSTIRKERLVWVLLLLVVIFATPVRNFAIGHLFAALLVAVILFALLVLPALLGAAAGSLTGATIRVVKRRLPRSK